jgi:hypothetical protein
MEAENTGPSGSRPAINHNASYTKYDRLTLALSNYWANFQRYTDEPIPANKPNVSRLAKDYSVTESMLRRHIKHPGQKTSVDTHQDSQVLTVSEEKVLVERLLFLDDFNIPADRDTLYSLAHELLHRRLPGRELGREWMYRFLHRHPDCQYKLVQTIATNRANAESWDIMDDFFGKVCTSRFNLLL